MKKLVGLMVLTLSITSLISCGKKNVAPAVTTPTIAPAVVNPVIVSSALTVTGQVEIYLGNLIDGNQFGLGQASYYENWAQYISHMPNTEYRYSNIAAGATTSSCVKIFGYCILNYNFSSSSNSTSSSGAAISRTVINSSVDLLTKKNELKALINARTYVGQQGSRFVIETSNKRYIIDTYLPIQANPTAVYNLDGSSEQLIGNY